MHQEMYHDALCELTNIGSNQMAASLSKHIKDEGVEFNVISTGFEKFSAVQELMCSETDSVVCYSPIYDGNLTGLFMLLIPLKSALVIAKLLSSESQFDYLTPKDGDRIVEMAEVCIASYLKAVNDFSKSQFKHNPAKIVVSGTANLRKMIFSFAGFLPQELFVFQVDFSTGKTFFEGDIKGFVTFREYDRLFERLSTLTE